ncbi:MAG: sugar transferase [Proteobacteria bacterium ST_bin12]|nr:MAG: sugar transferase [Proteobacteria bacterium ST_bin12]
MVKRAFDLLIAVAVSLMFAPLILVIALIIRLKIGRPVMFKQLRPGLHAKPFHIYKFRTMSNKKDEQGILLPDALRLSNFGRVVRSTSLDELPSLWNVLNGEMSLVGPRPLLMEYVPLYSKEQARRHNVKPGITGWAQVNGRNAISWEEKFKLDVWYVDNQSFWLDIKIIMLTIKKVLKRDDVNAAGEATMSKFTGSQNQ